MNPFLIISTFYFLLSCSHYDRSEFRRINQFLKEYDDYIEAKRSQFTRDNPIDIENKAWVKTKLRFMVELDQYMRSKTNLPNQALKYLF